MFSNRTFQIILLLTVITAAGCEVLHNAGVPGMERYVKKDPAVSAEEKSYRDEYNVHRDHKAFFWLLSHGVSNGMAMSEVEDVMGEPGEYTSEFTNLKSDGLYQTTDSAYRWGPDKSGQSAIIFFRDGHVINFNRKDYQTKDLSSSKPTMPTADSWGG